MKTLRTLKNPTNKPIEVTYNNVVTIFPPGEKTVDWEIANHALTMTKTKLVDVTNNLEEGESYTKLSIAKLLKLAKSRGFKVRFGMRKNELIDLLNGING